MDLAMIGWGKMGVHLAQRLMSGGQAVKKAE
jgi:6-phosphogluconate dehydrogenase (decarboxylating)